MADWSVSYTVQAGSTKLDTTSYNISNLKVTLTPWEETINDAGYNNFILPTQPLNLKSRLFWCTLGLPNADGSIKEYDTGLK